MQLIFKDFQESFEFSKFKNFPGFSRSPAPFIVWLNLETKHFFVNPSSHKENQMIITWNVSLPPMDKQPSLLSLQLQHCLMVEKLKPHSFLFKSLISGTWFL